MTKISTKNGKTDKEWLYWQRKINSIDKIWPRMTKKWQIMTKRTKKDKEGQRGQKRTKTVNECQRVTKNDKVCLGITKFDKVILTMWMIQKDRSLNIWRTAVYDCARTGNHQDGRSILTHLVMKPFWNVTSVVNLEITNKILTFFKHFSELTHNT